MSEPDNQSLGDEQSITRPDGSSVVSRIVMYDLHSVTSNTAAVQLVETEEIKISAKSGAKKGPSKNHGAREKHKHKHGHGHGHKKTVMNAQSDDLHAVIHSQQQQQLQQQRQEEEEQEQEEEKERTIEKAKQDLQIRMDRVALSGRVEREDGEGDFEPFSHNHSSNNNRPDLPPPPPEGGAPAGLRPPLITPLGPPVVKVQGLDNHVPNPPFFFEFL